MATLIEVYLSGKRRRCDARCYGAKGPNCGCICRSRNHGAGFQQAHQNTAQIAKEIIKEYSFQARFPQLELEPMVLGAEE